MMTFFEEVEVEEEVDRSEVDEGVFLTTIGLSLELSAVEETLRLVFTAGEALEALEGGRDRGFLGDVVPTVLLLAVDIVDAVDCRRERATVLGGISDLALSNVVEPLLVVDTDEAGREALEGGRRVEGPATDFRKVDA